MFHVSLKTACTFCCWTACPMYASSILWISYTVISLWHLAFLAISESGVVMSPKREHKFPVSLPYEVLAHSM